MGPRRVFKWHPRHVCSVSAVYLEGTHGVFERYPLHVWTATIHLFVPPPPSVSLGSYKCLEGHAKCLSRCPRLVTRVLSTYSYRCPRQVIKWEPTLLLFLGIHFTKPPRKPFLPFKSYLHLGCSGTAPTGNSFLAESITSDPSLFRTHFLFHRNSRPTAETLSRTLLPSKNT